MSKVRYALENGVAILTMSDPATMNAAGLDMAEDLTAAFDKAAKEARAAVLTGEGRGFCSGANLSGGGALGRKPADGPPDAGAALETTYNPLVTRMRDLPIPFVTAVNGAAAGVGMSLAIMADIVCASKNAYFLQAFARIGLVPDGGATFLLPRLIGWGRAMELSMLAEKLPAETAREWGLVNRLFEDQAQLMTGAMAIARQLADGPRSLGMIRRAYWESTRNSYEQQLDLEAVIQGQAGRTEDFKEGVTAFLEKRPAAFKGK